MPPASRLFSRGLQFFQKGQGAQTGRCVHRASFIKRSSSVPPSVATLRGHGTLVITNLKVLCDLAFDFTWPGLPYCSPEIEISYPNLFQQVKEF